MSAPISSTNGDGQTNGHSHDETATQNGNGVSQEQTNGANPQQNGQEHHHDHGIKRPAKIGTGLKDRPPGGFDPTPLPDAPQGYTIRFIFHGASNLAPGDFVTASSDPFLHATLKGTQPKRHKEDPDLTHRRRPSRNGRMNGLSPMSHQQASLSSAECTMKISPIMMIDWAMSQLKCPV
ncbi:hypothetical protein LB503_003677 [Fusarium chuoi]|nr:hypothetical protein LB503_003677 [Fusarium chuoi]